uniref:Uncharacterized protein n=1 Tax=Chlamydomonas leiostraca TaxID=1034604 RepID=A0A7S0S3T9_9CHLO|mmetsp:Transcript_4103/g.10276  ORF Transcript_4103/g.10276 Transcript_4103/m.10276 type:complete len:276 (+) Transcript_4103:106-933(+)|eukprot:CAMPEP_0202874720 /NCGR_PEP_ID=MMETSP1391-20130828/25909_1 /ASSEMBLY_ACC=CAM_ASM_000867 /TAXON_ID=1034604 /ORGANISM="Chlamydomonas leiostraca, Strain SAG 11-49" /LENGTH=275 /DNA_ID=CAMNT_0049556233 /DNA_START=42 /DNA_END=869 /DNA_ORIENTATION=+
MEEPDNAAQVSIDVDEEQIHAIEESWRERQNRLEEEALLRAIADAKAGLDPWQAEPSTNDRPEDDALDLYPHHTPPRSVASPLTALGVDLGAVDDTEREVETELQKFQAKMKKSVQNDIRKMLMSTKAYVKYHSPPPTISTHHLKELAAPKPNLAHPDTVLARALQDPTEYARVKATQLAVKRAQAERAEAERQKQQEHQAQQIQAYRQYKEQKKAQEAVSNQAAAAQQQSYGKEVSRYLKGRALQDIEAHKARVEAQRAKAQALQEQMARSGFR